MTLEYSTEELTSAGKAALFSVILYLFEPLSVFFTVPLHYQGLSRKKHSVVLLSVIAVILVITIRESIRYGGGGNAEGSLVFFLFGFGLPLTLAVAAGAFYMMRPLKVTRRLGIIFGAFGLLGVLLVGLFRANSELVAETMSLVEGNIDQIIGGVGVGNMLPPQQMAAAVVYTIERSLLLMFMVQFGIAFGAAWEFYKRKKSIPVSLLAKVKVPERFVWVLIISWTIVLFDIIFGLGLLGVIGWNAGLAAGLVYLLQGLAILQHFIWKKKNLAFSGLHLCGMLALLMLVPGLNMIGIAALGILGITEVWITYRKQENKENKQ